MAATLHIDTQRVTVGDLKALLSAHPVFIDKLVEKLTCDLVNHNNFPCAAYMLQSYPLPLVRLNVIMKQCIECTSSRYVKPAVLALISTLLRLGVDPNTIKPEPDGGPKNETLLMRAVMLGNVPVVRLLLIQGKGNLMHQMHTDDNPLLSTVLMVCFGNLFDQKLVRMVCFLLSQKPALLYSTIEALGSNLIMMANNPFYRRQYQFFQEKLVAYRQALFAIFLATSAKRFSPHLPTEVWMDYILPCMGPF